MKEWPVKDDLRSTTSESGALYVMTPSTTSMHQSSATTSALGR